MLSLSRVTPLLLPRNRSWSRQTVKGLLFDEKFEMGDTFMTEEEWLAELDQLFDLDDDIDSDLDEWFD